MASHKSGLVSLVFRFFCFSTRPPQPRRHQRPRHHGPPPHGPPCGACHLTVTLGPRTRHLARKFGILDGQNTRGHIHRPLPLLRVRMIWAAERRTWGPPETQKQREEQPARRVPVPPRPPSSQFTALALNKPSSSTTTTSSSLSASRALPPHARWPRSPPWLLLLGLAPAPACALASRASPRDRRVGEAAGEEVWRAWERSGGSLGQSGPPNGVQPSQKSESAALRLLVRSLLMRLLCSGELGVQIKHLPQDCPCLHHSLLTLCTQALTHAT
jgi:hypothetical protein